MIYTGTKSGPQFTIKDLFLKKYIHDLIYRTICPVNNFNEDYTGKCARKFEEDTKDHNGRDSTSHMSRHSIESEVYEVSEPDFQNNEKDY